MEALWLITALMLKHFVFDYVFQLKYMLEDKSYYLRVGGVHHAMLHGLGTVAVFTLMGYESVAGALGMIDVLIHYHVDYLKGVVTKWRKWDASCKNFWNAMGLDQLIHQLTYVLLVFLALAK